MIKWWWVHCLWSKDNIKIGVGPTVAVSLITILLGVAFVVPLMIFLMSPLLILLKFWWVFWLNAAGTVLG